VQHSKSMVPRSDMVAAFGFKIGEESPHVVGSEVGQWQFADWVAGRLSHEEKEEPDPVAVTSDRCLGEVLSPL